MPGGAFDKAAFVDAIRRRLDRYDRHADRLDDAEPGAVRGYGVFMDRFDAENFAEWLAGRLGQTGGPKGTVSFHLCSHSFGEPATESCKDPVTGYYERAG